MPDFESHSDTLIRLSSAQDADQDGREKIREIRLFLDKRDGQWEPYWWNANDGKPRYTFDITNPIIDQVWGAMARSDFDIRVKPAGGAASKETARLYDGLIRNIENISNAVHIYNQASKSVIEGGMDG